MGRWMRCLVILALLVTAPLRAAEPAGGASAKPPAVYGILSLIGDKLEIVVGQYQTGSNVDRSQRQQVEINDPVFDNMAVNATIQAIRKARPGAEMSHINTRSPSLFDKQRTLFAAENGKMGLPDAIRQVLKEQGATHLILIAKHRDEAEFKFYSGRIDTVRRLEGLGFFIDGMLDMETLDTNGNRIKSGRGFIAPYAYLNVSLVNLADARLIGSRPIKASFMATTGKTNEDIATPWAALDSQQKVRLISQLIQREVGDAVTALLGGS